MEIPQIPFIQKSKDQIKEDVLSSGAGTAQQQNIDLSGSQDRTAQYDYWTRSQDFSEEHMHIRALLEGKVMYYDKKGQPFFAYPKDEAGNEIIHPFCNAVGQSKIMSVVSTILQKGTPLSNYTASPMLDRCAITSHALIRQIHIKGGEWGIDPDEVELVVELIMDRIEAARRRSVDNIERSTVSTAIQILQNLTGSTQAKKGMMGQLQPSKL